MEQPQEHTPKGERDHEALSQAIEAAVVTEELQSAKEEKLDESMLETAAERLTLFPVELVAAGVVEIESSCGSDSSSTSSESDSSSSIPGGRASAVRYIEDVPPGQDFYKHVKSDTAHCCSLGETVSNCKLNMSGNFKKLERRFHFRHPKCLRCFPKDSNRIRNIEPKGITSPKGGSARKRPKGENHVAESCAPCDIFQGLRQRLYAETVHERKAVAESRRFSLD